MRTIDRYIARTFLEPLLIAVAVIAGLYMVADAFGNLEAFLRQAGGVGEALRRMGRIYLLRIPVFLKPVLPPSMLVGAAYGISQLSGRNELTALRACGVSLWRILAPVYTVAVAVAALGLANCEFVIPRVEEMTGREIKEWTGKDEFQKVSVLKEEEDAFFTVVYNAVTGEARSMTITLRTTGEYLQADQAAYVGGAWRLTNVTAGKKHLPEMTWKTSLTPQEIAMQLLEADVASLRMLRRFIAAHPERPRYVLLYHQRLAYPFEGLVLVALGLPFVIGNERIRRSRMLGVGLCVVICGVFYVVQFIAHDLGMSNHLPAQVAAWLPIIIFGALGLFLLETMES